MMKPKHAKAKGLIPPAPAKLVRILVPIDFSKPSQYALKTAVNFASRYGGRIILACISEPDPFSRLAENPLALSGEKLESKLKSELTSLGHKHIGKDCLEAVVVRSGKAFEEIIKVASEYQIDLIVMATHGYTGVKRVLLGSTAERVIRYAPCPVLTVQAEQTQNWLASSATA